MSSLPFPIPGSLPFDLCAPTPEGTKLCVQTGSIEGNIGEPRDCQNGSTPPLVSVDVTYQEETIEVLDDGEVLIENSVWIGVEEDLDAVWVGEETAEGCARFGLPDVDPTAAVDTVINTVDDVAKDVVRDLGQDPNRGTGQVLYAFLLVIIALIIVFDGFPFPA
ncbi:hypothetical protein [Halorubrum sp. Atlit-28R]|uniref:hypothetical protein n=1 Tax=Halorubrum sp. Atlit-28R TaxID=2282129 RepID=UPI000EF18E20|nr:hypothetical protein [Halorubrum sp. Atlit-28R]RLM49643.1 hypothetical protein DVK06_13905 [Halorubrum sp. Atlit-28R]